MLDVWFALSILAFLGLLGGLWRFWHPRDPLVRQSEDASELSTAIGRGQFSRQTPPHGLYLLDDEMLLQSGVASFYTSRETTQQVGGVVQIAGGGWLAGFRPNRPGFAFQETGALYLTSHRLLFVGARQSYSLPLQDIVQVVDETPWFTVWARQERHALRFRLQHATLWHDAVALLRERGAAAIAG